MAQAIARGASGASVKKIQKMLNKSGLLKSKLKEDGEYDAKTEAAVREFQQRQRMKETGSVEGLMLQALMETAKSAQRDAKDVRGVKQRKFNQKQQAKADALKGKTNDLKAMRDNANRMGRALDAYEKYLQSFEKKLATVGDDAQLVNIDLQNALQKQQQMLQTMSNVSKMLHDTIMVVVRRIG